MRRTTFAIAGVALLIALDSGAASEPAVSIPESERLVPKNLRLRELGIPSPETERSRASLRIAPTYEVVGSPKLMRYRTEADYPDYSSGFNGNGIEVPNGGSAPRSDAAIGIQTGWIEGGGCFPSNPNDPNSPCLVEADALGNPLMILKERERWVFRMSYIDPAVQNAPEVRVGFNGSFGFFGDDELVWVRSTSAGRRCFTFYSYYCNTYGIDLDYITASVRGFVPTCSNKMGPGYKGQIFYQYSRYSITDTIPPGANEWEPATVPATATRLEKPGREIWSSLWELDMSEGAVQFSVGGSTHPKIELTPAGNSNTGYTSVAPELAPATGTVSFRAYDCQPIPGVSFSLSTDFVPGSFGHVHTNPPTMSDVATITATSGTTDANGEWSTSFQTGRVASKLRLTAIGTINGRLFLKTADLDVGFRDLVDPGEDGSAIITYTGAVAGKHVDNHYGSGELHVMVRKMASYYNLLVPPADRGKIRLNDMSLQRGGLFDIAGTWAPSHYRHRFGTDADISRFFELSNGTLVTTERDLVKQIVETNLDGIYILESGGRMHVQVPEYMVGDILLRGTR